MIGAKLICEGKWGVGSNSSLTQSLNDFSGSAQSFASSKLLSPHLEKHSNLTQDTRIAESNTAESSYTKERLVLNADMPKGGEYQGIDNAEELQNLAKNGRNFNAAGLSMNFEGCQTRGEGSLLDANDQAECADSLKSRDKTTQGAGVWNMEQNDPDPFMQELNKQGLPYVVLEIDSNGDSKVLEDGRK